MVIKQEDPFLKQFWPERKTEVCIRRGGVIEISAKSSTFLDSKENFCDTNVKYVSGNSGCLAVSKLHHYQNSSWVLSWLIVGDAWETTGSSVVVELLVLLHKLKSTWADFFFLSDQLLTYLILFYQIWITCRRIRCYFLSS